MSAYSTEYVWPNQGNAEFEFLSRLIDNFKK